MRANPVAPFVTVVFFVIVLMLLLVAGVRLSLSSPAVLIAHALCFSVEFEMSYSNTT